jgi:hypothetical protein
MRPVCEKHPRSRVKRDGYYGVRKQCMRWKVHAVRALGHPVRWLPAALALQA